MISLPKILVFALVVAAVWFFFFRKKEVAEQQPKEKRDSFSGGKGEKRAPGEVMLECAKCGTFVSSAEAIIKDGRYYCSKECAEIK